MKQESPELNAQAQSIRVLKNTIKLLLKTSHAGTDAQALLEALTFLDKLVGLQEKQLEQQRAEALLPQSGN